MMCGRYQRRSDKQCIAEAFALGNVDGLALELTPDYNAAPQTMQPVIVWDERAGTRTAHMMFWRFLPPFVSDPKKFKLSTINAKGGTLLNNRLWHDSFLRRRCLIPADSFVEWKHEGKSRLPFIFAMKHDEPFALGGVWRRWRSSDRDTFAIITIEPNELVEEKTSHDRMPLIVERKNWQRWLEPGSPEQPPVDLLRPYDADKMKAWRVDARINNVKNNDATLSEPLRDEGGKDEDGQFGSVVFWPWAVGSRRCATVAQGVPETYSDPALQVVESSTAGKQLLAVPETGAFRTDPNVIRSNSNACQSHEITVGR